MRKAGFDPLYELERSLQCLLGRASYESIEGMKRTRSGTDAGRNRRNGVVELTY